MNDNLIFDIGANIGSDALFYAQKGYNVIAVDADPFLIEKNKSAISDPSIRFLNYAIADKDDELIPLFLSNTHEFSSLCSSLAQRRSNLKDVVNVRSKTLKALFDEYGVPFYCKVDIEGFDHIAVRSMGGAAERPLYMSVEAECKPEDEKFSENGIFDTLDALADAGYTKFKLIDQTTLAVLSFKDYYLARTRLSYKVIRKLQKMFKAYSAFYTNKQRLTRKFKYPFTYDASGPFGNELDGNWINYGEAKKLYLHHRRAFFSHKANHPSTFWVDWHATY